MRHYPASPHTPRTHLLRDVGLVLDGLQQHLDDLGQHLGVDERRLQVLAVHKLKDAACRRRGGWGGCGHMVGRCASVWMCRWVKWRVFGGGY